MTTWQMPKRRWALRWSSVFTVATALLMVTTMSVQAAAAPSNDNISNAVRVSSTPFRATANTSEATLASTDPECGVATVWYRFRPRVSGIYVASTQGSDYDTTLALLSGPRRSLSPIDARTMPTGLRRPSGSSHQRHDLLDPGRHLLRG